MYQTQWTAPEMKEPAKHALFRDKLMANNIQPELNCVEVAKTCSKLKGTISNTEVTLILSGLFPFPQYKSRAASKNNSISTGPCTILFYRIKSYTAIIKIQADQISMK